MEIPLTLAAGAAHFIFVFLKAFQQRNVAFLHYHLVIPISIGMALAEVFIISAVARVGFSVPLFLGIGIGGGFGAMLAMWVHERYVT